MCNFIIFYHIAFLIYVTVDVVKVDSNLCVVRLCNSNIQTCFMEMKIN